MVPSASPESARKLHRDKLRNDTLKKTARPLTKKRLKKQSETESQLKYRNRPTHISDSFDEAGYAADDSDSSDSLFALIQHKKPKYIVISPEDVIDTSDVILPESVVQDNLCRNMGIRLFWNDLALRESGKRSAKRIKFITNPFIRYLGSKLNALFHKFTTRDIPPGPDFPGVPSAESLALIFATHTMSVLIREYYNMVNSPILLKNKVRAETEDEHEIMRIMFRMLEKDFDMVVGGAKFVDKCIDKYTETLPLN